MAATAYCTSKDLRLRVLAAVDRGERREEIAPVFRVSLATIGRYVKRRRETGEVVAGRLRGRGIGFALAHAKRPARERLARTGAEGAGVSLHATVREALTREGNPYGWGAPLLGRGYPPVGSAGKRTDAKGQQGGVGTA